MRFPAGVSLVLLLVGSVYPAGGSVESRAGAIHGLPGPVAAYAPGGPPGQPASGLGGLLAHVWIGGQQAGDEKSAPQSLRSLAGEIEAYRTEHYPETRVAFWAESMRHGLVCSNAEEVWPAASGVKVFILLAAYREFGDRWDGTPPELEGILGLEEGCDEPLGHFASADRERVRRELGGMSYSELAYSMMGNNQASIGNSAYNAAANVLIFLLGGDSGGCTGSIRELDPEFDSVRIGRYMLEGRTPENDNVCSLKDLVVACKMVFEDEDGYSTLAESFQRFTYEGCDHYQKHGHLSSRPGVNLWVGWISGDDDTLVYGVIVTDPEGTSLGDEGADYYLDAILSGLSAL